MKWLKPVPLMALCVVISGCGTRTDVVVTDHDGSPVAGAKVQPLAFSINYRPKITDKKGRVAVPWTTEKVKWLNVSAKGFRRSAVIYKGGKEQAVVLERPGPRGMSPEQTGDPPPVDVPLEGAAPPGS